MSVYLDTQYANTPVDLKSVSYDEIVKVYKTKFTITTINIVRRLTYADWYIVLRLKLDDKDYSAAFSADTKEEAEKFKKDLLKGD